jgi:DNA polymerase-3 subunit delta
MIHILYGADSFSRAERLRALNVELDADGNLASNTVVFDARQAGVGEVLAACDTVPFFGDARLVILEGALRPAGGRGGRKRAKVKEAEDEGTRGPWWALVDYAARMPEKTALVLLDGESVDTGLLGALKPLATVERFALPGPREIAGWVQSRARMRGLQIDGRGCALMAELVGSDTWILASEIDKLATYAAGQPVREADVRALVSDVRDHEGYLLADAVAEGKPAVATRLLHDMLAKDRPPAVLLLTIENRYRRIAVAREMLDAGATGRDIAARLRIDNPFPLERLLDQVARYPATGVRWALDRIARADYDVKQGVYDEVLSLELLVQDLAAPTQAAGAGQRVSAPAGSS